MPARTLLLDLGRPGVAIEAVVVGTEGRYHAVSGDDGYVELRLAVDGGDRVRLTAADESHVLDVVREVPVDDPEVTIYWDLTADLGVFVRGPAAETGTGASDDAAAGAVSDVVLKGSESGEPGAPSARIGVADGSEGDDSEAHETRGVPASPVFRDPEECRGRKSFACMQALRESFVAHLEAGRCPGALAAVDRLIADFPELLLGGGAVVSFAEAYRECGVSRGREEWIRHAVELLESRQAGDLWCFEDGSRALGRAYLALGDLAAATFSAAAAAQRCQGDEVIPPLVWGCLFEARRESSRACLRFARLAPPRLAPVLRAWGGECGGDLSAAEELCRTLPADVCASIAGRILLDCGRSPEDFAAAARLLGSDRSSADGLPVDSEEVGLLGEAEYRSGDFAAASVSLGRALEGRPTSGRRWRWLRFYADAVALSSSDPQRRRAALAAYNEVAAAGFSDAVVEAIVLNNRLRLSHDLGAPPAAAEIERLRSLISGLETAPETPPRLRLLLRLGWLGLELERVENEPDLDSQERLAGLADLRSAFAALAEDLRNYGDTEESELLIDVGGEPFVVLTRSPR